MRDKKRECCCGHDLKDHPGLGKCQSPCCACNEYIPLKPSIFIGNHWLDSYVKKSLFIALAMLLARSIWGACTITPPRGDLPYKIIYPTLPHTFLSADGSQGTAVANTGGSGSVSRTKSSSLCCEFITSEWEGFAYPSGINSSMVQYIYVVFVSQHQVTGNAGIVYHQVGTLPWNGSSAFASTIATLVQTSNPWATQQFSAEIAPNSIPLTTDLATLGVMVKNDSTLNYSTTQDVTTIDCTALVIFGTFPTGTGGGRVRVSIY